MKNLTLTKWIAALMAMLAASSCFADSGFVNQFLASWQGDDALLIIILFILFILYNSWIIHTKNAQVCKAINKLDKKSSIWHLQDIQTRIQDVFNKWFEAHSKNDADIVRDFVSQHLYNHCVLEFNQLTEKGIKDVFTTPKLMNFHIMSLHAGAKEEQDILWTYIKYTQSEYKIKERTEELVDGKPGLPSFKKQLWKFINFGVVNTSFIPFSVSWLNSRTQ